MDDNEVIKTILICSQRALPACNLDQAYALIKDAGITDEQIRNCCSDYFIVNTCGYQLDE